MSVIQEIRLAMRVEGDFWCAYYARRWTMDGAVRIGSIRMSLVTGLEQRGRKEMFMRLMQEAMSAAVEASGGETIRWNDPQPAPEREKAGSRSASKVSLDTCPHGAPQCTEKVAMPCRRESPIVGRLSPSWSFMLPMRLRVFA